MQIMREARTKWAVAAWVVVAGAGCAKEPAPPTLVEGGTASAAATDPELTALVPQIEACGWDDRLGLKGYKACAPAETAEKLAPTSPKGFATMVAWVQAPSPAVRSVGAGGLWLGAFSDAQRKDCDGGKRVQAALAKESAPAVAWRLANAWHQFVRRCPEQDRDFQAFVGNRAFAVVEARRVVVSDLAPEVLARPGWFETLATVVYDLRDDPDVRESAPKAFKNLPPERKRAGAAILRGLLGERAPERTVPRPLPGPDLAEQAAMTLASMQADEGFADVVEAARRELAAGGSGRGSCRRSTST